jgi:hypothetical protein
MAKQIQSFTLEIRQIGAAKTGFVRYNVNDSEFTDLSKYSEFNWDVTGTDTIDSEMLTIENDIKTRESIS